MQNRHSNDKSSVSPRQASDDVRESRSARRVFEDLRQLQSIQYSQQGGATLQSSSSSTSPLSTLTSSSSSSPPLEGLRRHEASSGSSPNGPLALSEDAMAALYNRLGEALLAEVLSLHNETTLWTAESGSDAGVECFAGTSWKREPFTGGKLFAGRALYRVRFTLCCTLAAWERFISLPHTCEEVDETVVDSQIVVPRRRASDAFIRQLQFLSADSGSGSSGTRKAACLTYGVRRQSDAAAQRRSSSRQRFDLTEALALALQRESSSARTPLPAGSRGSSSRSRPHNGGDGVGGSAVPGSAHVTATATVQDPRFADPSDAAWNGYLSSFFAYEMARDQRRSGSQRELIHVVYCCAPTCAPSRVVETLLARVKRIRSMVARFSAAGIAAAATTTTTTTHGRRLSFADVTTSVSQQQSAEQYYERKCAFVTQYSASNSPPRHGPCAPSSSPEPLPPRYPSESSPKVSVKPGERQKSPVAVKTAVAAAGLATAAEADDGPAPLPQSSASRGAFVANSFFSNALIDGCSEIPVAEHDRSLKPGDPVCFAPAPQLHRTRSSGRAKGERTGGRRSSGRVAGTAGALGDSRSPPPEGFTRRPVRHLDSTLPESSYDEVERKRRHKQHSGRRKASPAEASAAAAAAALDSGEKRGTERKTSPFHQITTQPPPAHPRSNEASQLLSQSHLPSAAKGLGEPLRMYPLVNASVRVTLLACRQLPPLDSSSYLEEHDASPTVCYVYLRDTNGKHFRSAGAPYAAEIDLRREQAFRFPVLNFTDCLTVTVAVQTSAGHLVRLGTADVHLGYLRRGTPMPLAVALVGRQGTPDARERGVVDLSLYPVDYGFPSHLLVPRGEESQLRKMIHAALVAHQPSLLHRLEWYVGQYRLRAAKVQLPRFLRLLETGKSPSPLEASSGHNNSSGSVARRTSPPAASARAPPETDRRFTRQEGERGQSSPYDFRRTTTGATIGKAGHPHHRSESPAQGGTKRNFARTLSAPVPMPKSGKRWGSPSPPPQEAQPRHGTQAVSPFSLVVESLTTKSLWDISAFGPKTDCLTFFVVLEVVERAVCDDAVVAAACLARKNFTNSQSCFVSNIIDYNNGVESVMVIAGAAAPASTMAATTGSGNSTPARLCVRNTEEECLRVSFYAGVPQRCSPIGVCDLSLAFLPEGVATDSSGILVSLRDFSPDGRISPLARFDVRCCLMSDVDKGSAQNATPRRPLAEQCVAALAARQVFSHRLYTFLWHRAPALAHQADLFLDSFCASRPAPLLLTSSGSWRKQRGTPRDSPAATRRDDDFFDFCRSQYGDETPGGTVKMTIHRWRTSCAASDSLTEHTEDSAKKTNTAKKKKDSSPSQPPLQARGEHEEKEKEEKEEVTQLFVFACTKCDGARTANVSVPFTLLGAESLEEQTLPIEECIELSFVNTGAMTADAIHVSVWESGTDDFPAGRELGRCIVPVAALALKTGAPGCGIEGTEGHVEVPLVVNAGCRGAFFHGCLDVSFEVTPLNVSTTSNSAACPASGEVWAGFSPAWPYRVQLHRLLFRGAGEYLHCLLLLLWLYHRRERELVRKLQGIWGDDLVAEDYQYELRVRLASLRVMDHERVKKCYVKLYCGEKSILCTADHTLQSDLLSFDAQAYEASLSLREWQQSCVFAKIGRHNFLSRTDVFCFASLSSIRTAENRSEPLTLRVPLFDAATSLYFGELTVVVLTSPLLLPPSSSSAEHMSSASVPPPSSAAAAAATTATAMMMSTAPAVGQRVLGSLIAELSGAVRGPATQGSTSVADYQKAQEDVASLFSQFAPTELMRVQPLTFQFTDPTVAHRRLRQALFPLPVAATLYLFVQDVKLAVGALFKDAQDERCSVVAAAEYGSCSGNCVVTHVVADSSLGKLSATNVIRLDVLVPMTLGEGARDPGLKITLRLLPSEESTGPDPVANNSSSNSRTNGSASRAFSRRSTSMTHVTTTEPFSRSYSQASQRTFSRSRSTNRPVLADGAQEGRASGTLGSLPLPPIELGSAKLSLRALLTPSCCAGGERGAVSFPFVASRDGLSSSSGHSSIVDQLLRSAEGPYLVSGECTVGVQCAFGETPPRWLTLQHLHEHQLQHAKSSFERLSANRADSSAVRVADLEDLHYSLFEEKTTAVRSASGQKHRRPQPHHHTPPANKTIDSYIIPGVSSILSANRGPREENLNASGTDVTTINVSASTPTTTQQGVRRPLF